MSIYMDSYVFIFCVTLTAVMGAVFGSFLNCAAMRIVRGESFTRDTATVRDAGIRWGPLS